MFHSFGTQFPVPRRGSAMLPSHFACWYQNPSVAQTVISFNYSVLQGQDCRWLFLPTTPSVFNSLYLIPAEKGRKA